MKVSVQVQGDAALRIQELADSAVVNARENLVREATILGLQAVIEGNPVQTARSRAAWVESLEQLGGPPPPGWEGADPRAATEGRQLARLSQSQTQKVSKISATSGVKYVGYLEYGTTRTAPFAMVRRALLSLRTQLAGLFRLSAFLMAISLA